MKFKSHGLGLRIVLSLRREESTLQDLGSVTNIQVLTNLTLTKCNRRKILDRIQVIHLSNILVDD